MKSVLIVAALLVACAYASLDDCTFNIPALNHTYDLNSLSHIPGDREVLYHRNSDGNVLYVNFCNRTTVICPGNTSNVCLLTPDYKYVVRGSLETYDLGDLEDKTYGDDGFTASFVSGEQCKSANVTGYYHTKVNVYCAAVPAPQVIDFVGDENSCELVMYVKSRAACKVNPPSSSSSAVPPTPASSSHKHSSSSASMASYSLVSLAVLIVVLLF